MQPRGAAEEEREGVNNTDLACLCEDIASWTDAAPYLGSWDDAPAGIRRRMAQWCAEQVRESS